MRVSPQGTLLHKEVFAELAEQSFVLRFVFVGILQSKGIDALVLREGRVNLAEHLLEMGLDVCCIIHSWLCPHGVEVIVLLQPFLYLLAETVAYLALPCRLLAVIVAGIE